MRFPASLTLAIGFLIATLPWGECRAEDLRLFHRGAYTLDFSGDGKRLATATSRELRIWDIDTGRSTNDQQTGPAIGCSYQGGAITGRAYLKQREAWAVEHGSGSLLLVSNHDDVPTKLIPFPATYIPEKRHPENPRHWVLNSEPHTRKLLHVRLSGVASSEDGELWAVGTFGRIYLMHGDDEQMKNFIEVEPMRETTVRSSDLGIKDPRYLAYMLFELTWSPDAKEISLWDGANSQTAAFEDLAVSPDKRYVIGKYDRSVLGYDIATKKCVFKQDDCKGLALSGNGDRIAIWKNNGTVEIFKFPGGEMLGCTERFTAQPMFSWNGDRVLGFVVDEFIACDAETGATLHKAHITTDPLQVAGWAASPTEDRIVYTSSNWDVGRIIFMQLGPDWLKN